MTVVISPKSSEASTLINRNVTVNGHRTSMRLEPAMWEALEDVCHREHLSVHEVCSYVDSRRTQSSLTAAMRVFILGYFRAAVTETGHALAGHGGNGATAFSAQPQSRKVASQG